MDEVPLDNALAGLTCPRCEASTKIVDVLGGARLLLTCSPSCGWTGRAELPALRKRLVYLDTATVSNMAKAKQPGWVRLRDALTRASALEVVACPFSPTVRAEAELSVWATEIIDLARQLGATKLRPRADVEEAQMLRALDRFLGNEVPVRESAPCLDDAFNESPHAWLSSFSIFVNYEPIPQWISERRDEKRRIRDRFEEAYRRYADKGASFDEIRRNEARGYGRGILTSACRTVRQRRSMEPTSQCEWLVSLLVDATSDARGKERAGQIAIEFLNSEHLALIPYADCNARLHAAVAMTCRGSGPRIPRESDVFDLRHIASYAPYVDVLITDAFFADVCRQTNLGEPWGTEIRSLRPREIDEFVAQLDEWTEESAVVPLAERVRAALSGSAREFADQLRRHLDEQGPGA